MGYRERKGRERRERKEGEIQRKEGGRKREKREGERQRKEGEKETYRRERWGGYMIL